MHIHNDEYVFFMTGAARVKKEKLTIAVSRCLLGDAVRYDGTDKYEAVIAQLADNYQLLPFCPEMAIGLGVPRPPIHLRERNGEVRVEQVDNPAVDVTAALQDFARTLLQQHAAICGVIFKQHSPSCGPADVKLMNAQGEYQRTGRGQVAAVVQDSLPALPVVDEQDCLDPRRLQAFLQAVQQYAALNRQ